MTTITIDGNVHDVYSNVAEAEIYLGARLGADAWNNATTVNKEKALVTSTRIMDRHIWKGERTAPAPGQPLEWPRTGVTDKYGNDLSSVTVPTQVFTGSQELALALLRDATVQDGNGRSVKSLKVAGDMDVEFIGVGSQSVWPQAVRELLEQFMDKNIAGESFGTDEVSIMDDDAEKSELAEAFK